MIDQILGTAIAVSFLIVLVLIIRRPFARVFGARATYTLWILPFIRLVMPEITIPRIFPKAINEPLPEAVLSSDIALTPEMIAALQAPPNLMSQAELYIIPAFLTLWAFGAVVFFLYHWTMQASLMKRLSHSSKPAECLRQDIISTAQTLAFKNIPEVRISDKKDGPLVAGLFRPVVILPKNFMTAFSPQQRRYALLHEFMHIKRGDVWVALAWLVFRALNWPNPLVHYAAKHFRSDQEAACDASVLSVMNNNQEAVIAYAETLIHAAKSAIIDGRVSPQLGALALTIHHPLKERLMILGTHRKISNWRSRTAAAVMIIGAATLSAPLIQADAHPEGELAGKHQSKSSNKQKIKANSEVVFEHFEINVDGDDVQAYEIDLNGNKTRIDVEDIEGINVEDILNGKTNGSLKRSFTFNNSETVQMMTQDDFKTWADTQIPELKEEDLASWLNGDYAEVYSDEHKGKVIIRNENGKTHFEFDSSAEFPQSPIPPSLSGHSKNVFVFENDEISELNTLKKLEALKGLDGQEKLKALGELKNGFETFTFFSDGGDMSKLETGIAGHKLAVARAMLENTKIKSNDSREMVKAKRELEKARKALKAAEQALKDAK